MNKLAVQCFNMGDLGFNKISLLLLHIVVLCVRKTPYGPVPLCSSLLLVSTPAGWLVSSCAGAWTQDELKG